MAGGLIGGYPYGGIHFRDSGERVNRNSLSPWILTLSGVLMFFCLYVTGPIWPLYLQAKGLETGALGLIMGLYGFALIFSRTPIGLLSERSVGYRRLLISAGFIIIALGMVSALYPIPVMLGLGRILIGIGAGFFVPIVILHSVYFPDLSLFKSMGRSAAFFGLGQIPAHPLGGFLADRFGFEVTFWLSAVFALLGALLVLIIKEPLINRAGITKLPKSRLLYSASLLMAAVFFVVFGTAYTLTPLYVDSALAASKTVQGLLLMTFLATYVAAVLNSFKLTDAFGVIPVVVLGIALTGISSFLTPFAGLMLLFFCEFLLGVGLGLTWGSLMALSVCRVDPELRFGAMGVFQSIYAVGMFAGPAVSSQVAQHWDLASAFYLNAAVAAAASLYALSQKTEVENTASGLFTKPSKKDVDKDS
jgi:MFS family permease